MHTLSAKLSEEQKRRDDEWPDCLGDLSDQPLVKRYVGQKLDSQTVMRVCDVNTESLSQAEAGINSRMKGYGVDRLGTVFEPGDVESIYRVFSEIVLRVFLGRRYACLGTFQTSMEVRRNLEVLEIKIPSVNVGHDGTTR